MGIFRALYHLITAGGAAAEIAGYVQEHDCESAQVATDATQSATQLLSNLDTPIPPSAYIDPNVLNLVQNTTPSVSELYSAPDAMATATEQFTSAQGHGSLAGLVELLFD